MVVSPSEDPPPVLPTEVSASTDSTLNFKETFSIVAFPLLPTTSNIYVPVLIFEEPDVPSHVNLLMPLGAFVNNQVL